MTPLATFKAIDNIDKCSDLINQPCDDYPNKVELTSGLISAIVNQHHSFIVEFDVKMIHHIIMSETDKKGEWCLDENENRIKEIFPVYKDSSHDLSMNNPLIRWYRSFLDIQPFLEGNERVAGIVVAVLSYDLNTGKMLMPAYNVQNGK